MRTYRGWRDAQGGAHVTVNGRPLKLRLDIDNHSPTGFEWGYQGSGPAQLALALIADATGSAERALRRHQAFKRAFVAKLPSDREWSLTEADVRLLSLRAMTGPD